MRIFNGQHKQRRQRTPCGTVLTVNIMAQVLVAEQRFSQLILIFKLLIFL